MSGFVILVFGISGVGKTFACKDFVARHPEFLHLSAGGLLRDATATNRDQLRTASATQILNNQMLLGELLQKCRMGQWERPVLVDAHGIIDNDQELVTVPTEVVRTMNPNGLILLEAPPNVIIRRRAESVIRRPERSIEHIKKEAILEREAVFNYSKDLNLPLETSTVDEFFLLDGLITTLKNKMASRHF